MKKQKVVIITGAGISAESGLKMFRDSNGLWEGHDVMQVASPQGWTDNMELVLDFYNQRRRQLLEVQPNKAHTALVTLEDYFDVHVITQNVDDLHERAGSSHVLHLHGELLKVRSTFDEDLIFDWKTDLRVGDMCEHHFQLRPHIVWFGEMVPLLEPAAHLVSQADYILIIGTSMQVYPAASLIDFAKQTASIHFVDPKPAIATRAHLTIHSETATVGVPKVVNTLIEGLDI